MAGKNERAVEKKMISGPAGRVEEMASKSQGLIDASTQSALGKRMRQNAVDTLSEPMPARLSTLLEQLRRREASHGGGR